MNAIRFGMMVTILLVGARQVKGQAELPPAAGEVLTQFEDECTVLDKKTEADIAKQCDKSATELKKLQDHFCKEARLDEALAIRYLIRSLKTKARGAVSSDLPAAAKEVYKQHEDEIAAIEKRAEADYAQARNRAAAELKKAQDIFCKEAKLDEAVAIRDVIRTLREGTTNALPDPGYVNNAPADIGKVFYYAVTGTDKSHSIYGTDIYTTGSHLGMAAVHCGLLKDGQKGVVKVTILPGQATYSATLRHGIRSHAYSNWSVSFKVERGYRIPARPSATAGR